MRLFTQFSLHSSFAVVLALSAAAADATAQTRAGQPRRYQDLTALFQEWRAFQHPRLDQGVPDYTAVAMAAQQRALPSWQRRLAAIDTTGWSIAQKVDWHIVRAELNGLDFDHRVIRPWSRNPAFYVTVFPSQSDQPAREGHWAYGSLELWSYRSPLSTTDAAEVSAKLRAVPALLQQARRNLVGNARDLWNMGIRSLRQQSSALQALEGRVVDNAGLAGDTRRARAATDSFVVWLERQAPGKTGPSGVGIENYDWYLANVQLVPYTWHDQVTIMQRELARSRAALALEEQRNRALPLLLPIASSEEWERRFNAAVTEYIGFFRDREILTVLDYMEPALRARVGRFSAGPREFFSEVNHRDPIVMRTHDFHWIDLAQLANAPHASPIRRGPLLYNIFITRTEGLATAMEELMMHAGFLDTHPRGRELIYVLVAQRAARALGDLMMHANRYTIDQAAAFAVAETPRGWLRADGNTVWGEQHLYLQQPAYGTSYLIGKIQIEQLLSDRRQQLGADFTLRRFMDEFTAVGMIPMSLAHWELTGRLGAR
ncbi:MAG: DUF885 family protein [Gemmatimonadota bacterium]